MSSPIIFEKGTRDFSTLGLGLLSDAIQATTTEELNGQFIFEMDYPVSGNNAELIKENCIIVVNSGHILKRQGFIIRQIVRKIDLTMTVYAEHVSYATLDVALAPVGTISGDAKTALENWKRMLVPTVDFTVDSDILTTNSTSIGAPEFETARQGLGGHAGSILDVWGGEYQFDNWHIRLLKQRGKSANAIIAYGRNLISFEQDTNIADTYTSVYPYYQENLGDEGNKNHFLPERTVDSEFVGKYPNPKVLMLDLSNKFKDVADYSETKLRNYALSYIQSNNIGVPKVNMKISTVDLSRATGGFSEDIDLGDTVNVYFEKLGITTSAKVIKAVWNVLSDDYDKFEIGARRSSLTESVSELATTADENANKALNQALIALQSADGKTTIYYLDSSDPWPTNPKENDTAFVKDGENSIMYRYTFNNDTGVFSWVKILDSMSADQIKQRVSDALESGKAYSDQLVAENASQINTVLDDVQAKQADLTAQQAELDTKAQGYANKALSDAKADTLATATQTAKDASDALAKAKTDLTTSLNKEVTDRANAVTALDNKAKGYADTAKADAISASTTALNTAKTDLTTSITKEVTDRTKAVSDLDTKAQGYATQAKTDAIATANGAVAKEVTDRQKAITDLDAKSTGAINQAKTDAQSALDALQVGGRNLVLNSATPHTGTGTNSTNNTQSNFNYPLSGGETTGSLYTKWGVNSPYTVSFDWSITGATVAGTFQTLWNNAPYGLGGQPVITVSPTNTSGHVSFTVKVLSTWAGTSANGVWLRMDNLQGTLTLTNFKLEKGNKATDYTQAPEDIVLDYTTKDNVISQSLTQYQATNDGKVTKAQSDATQALGLVATKVSQTDYNTKTGDLDSKYTAVKQTADQASTDIVAIKSTNTSQDTKINTLTSDVSGTKQSISDIQTEQGKQSTKINTIQTDVSGTKQDISDIKDANGVQDGKIASISTTVDGLSSSFSTYKTTNDGKVAKAQADITANSTAISQKVSQTAYDAKTGQLQTDLNTTTTTANQAKTDIVAIKKTNTDQDTRMTTIESDANGIKTTVSSLQTTANTQAGSISTLQQRADGFDATVTKVNNLSVGGRNWLLDSKTPKSATGNNGSNQIVIGYGLASGMNSGKMVSDWGAGTYITLSFDWTVTGSTTSGKFVPQFYPQPYSPFGPQVMVSSTNTSGHYTGVKVVGADWVGTSAPTINFRLDAFQGTFTVSNIKFEQGNMPTAWTPAPEDVDSATAKAQLTADNASLALSNYKTDADGRISKAQSDITANASAITQKVAQTVYDAKVGDLTTKVSTAQQTADSVTTSLNSYKSSNDSKVTKAQADIVVNTNAIATKVSQTAYDAKTGQLQTDLNTTTTTANQAKTDIVAIKSDNTKQDARMTTIESDANGTKTTVSNLQTDLGKANGSITTLQQRADGFDATVTKVNSMAVGGRNLLLDTGRVRTGTGTNTDNNGQDVFKYTLAGNQNTSTLQSLYGTGTAITISFDWEVTGSTISGVFYPQWQSQPWGVGEGGASGITVSSTNTSGHYVWSSKIPATWANFTANVIGLRMNYLNGVLTLRNFKFETGNMPTAWTPAPEDVDSATAKAQLTADNATLSINNYKTDADGRISKAQADIIVNAKAITQKVSQSDYNAKTGDLTTKVNTAQSTADSATSTIGAYKTSNDARVASAESKITANANAITSKVSQTDYNTKTGQIDGQISTINQTAGNISQTVSDVKAQVDGLSVGGRNWLLDTKTSKSAIGNNTSNQGSFYYTLASGMTSGKMYTDWGVGSPFTISFDWVVTGSTISGEFGPQLVSQPYGIGAPRVKVSSTNTSGHYVYTSTSIASNWARTSANSLTFRLEYLQGTVTISNIKFEQGNLPTAWGPAPEDTDNKISTVSQTVNSISSIVSDPTTGLTKRVQTAEGSISTVQSNVSGLQSQQTQTANGLTTEISNRATGDTNTLTQAKDFTTSSITSSETGMRSQITQTSDAIIAQIGNTNLVFNSEFDPDNDGWYKVPAVGQPVSAPIKTPITTAFSDWEEAHGSRGVLFDGTNGNWWTSKPIRVAQAGVYSMSMLAGRPSASDTTVTTDFRLGLWDADKKYIGTIGSSDPMNGTTYLPLTLYKTENLTIPDGTQYISFVLVRNASADVIYQPMLNYGAKSVKYTPTYGTNSSSTILSLLKDNWSIGIADNAGAITSGIVGNASNMSLISNNVTINSPQTQIKGTAWINSAMIGNGQIGNAQIGDASISSAKIMNLDVNKITGNVSSFIQSNWNGKYASTSIDSSGMSINGGSTTTKFDTSGAHYSNSSGISATYSFGKWSDQSGRATSSTGLYLGATGSENAFINILGTNGAAALVLAGSAMDYGANLNVMQGTLNSYVNVNIRTQLHFKGNKYNSPSYIEINESNRTFNFFTGGGSVGGGNYFYFNQNVISAGTFSSTSVLSKKNVKSVYDEDALSEIAKTQLVNFEYKNRIGQNHVSPIIDDVNSEKEYYIPKTILGQDNKYVDLYSMISMTWKAIQQLNEKIGDK